MDDERRIPTGQIPPEDNVAQTDESPTPSVEPSAQVAVAPAKPKNKFEDEFGNPTWYAKNISGTIIAISDPALPVSIGIGEVVDLLQKADEDTIRKSPDIRKCFDSRNAWLKRLSEDEYRTELSAQAAIQAQIQSARANLEKEAPKEITRVDQRDMAITNKTQSMVEKLKIGAAKTPGERMKGLTVVEFLYWLKDVTLTPDEVEYILGSITNKEVRKAVMIKSGAETVV